MSFKKELLLNFNAFQQQATYSDLNALARVFQNILLFKPGNFPNQPELGVGIQDYLYEFMDRDTISILETHIKSQCEKFAPTNYIYSVKVEPYDNDKHKKTLAIFFYLSQASQSNNEPDIGLLMTMGSNKQVLSQIYV